MLQPSLLPVSGSGNRCESEESPTSTSHTAPPPSRQVPGGRRISEYSILSDDSSNCVTGNGPDGYHELPARQHEADSVYSSIDALPERIRQIAVLRGLGYSFREIGRELKVTPQAVSLMLSRHRHSLKALKGSAELADLSARAVNALGRHGIRSREKARKMEILARLVDERNCGAKTIEEIRRWLERAEAACRQSDPAIKPASKAEPPRAVGCEGASLLRPQ
jgi:predicted transcriptional regulator